MLLIPYILPHIINLKSTNKNGAPLKGESADDQALGATLNLGCLQGEVEPALQVILYILGILSWVLHDDL